MRAYLAQGMEAYVAWRENQIGAWPAAFRERVLGPAAAIDAGATHLVVGRPITAAADPARAAREILGEMRGHAIA